MITDPWFYALAIPAVLIAGIAKSGFGGGFAALSTPLIAMTVPVPQAAAIMLPVLCVMDAFGIANLMKERDRGLVRLLLPAGLLGTLVGTLLFGLLPAAAVAGVVGALTLAFVAIRTIWPPRADAPPPPRWLGFTLGTVSGFTSFVVHAGSPPLAFYMLPLKLPPIRFAATLAVFFAAVNLAKWPTYGWLGLIDGRNLLTSAVLIPLAPIGVWIGIRAARRLPMQAFYGVINAGMVLTGAKLLWDAFR